MGGAGQQRPTAVAVPSIRQIFHIIFIYIDRFMYNSNRVRVIPNGKNGMRMENRQRLLLCIKWRNGIDGKEKTLNRQWQCAREREEHTQSYTGQY